MSSIGQGSISIDDSTRIGENAQDTADNAVGGVADLNNPNLMNVIEKQNNIGQFAGLTSQYSVLVQNAKDDGIDTTAVTTVYNNLNQFMASILADPNHASNVDRVAYKKYQDAYNEELSKLQNALQNNANNKFTSAASAANQAAATASQAQSSADNAFNQAQLIGNQASSAIAVQSAATAKAQSTADSAFSQAVTAIDNGKVTSQAVADLKDGSTLTIAQLENGLASKVSNSDYTTYKTQTANQIGQMVTNSNFSAYQQTTADLIAQKVSTKDFSAYQATTAKAISSKVESSDFNTYKTQTADMISSKVSTADFKNLKISNRNLALETATTVTMTGENRSNQVQDGYGFSSVIPYGTVVTVSFDVSSSTGVGDFTMQFYGGEPDGKPASSWQIISEGSLVNGTKHISVTLTTDSDHLHVRPRLDNATGTVTISKFIISESSKEVSWSPAPEDQATKSQITQLSGEISSKVDSGDFSSYKTQTAKDINLRVATKDLIDQINVQAGNTLISSSGQLTLSGKTIYFDSTNPVIIPSANIDKLLVDKKLTAADISANTFTTNNGTFTVDQNGAITANNMTLIGGTLTSPTINTSTLNTPQLNLGLNGTFTEDFDYTQATTMFLPKKNKGTLTFNHGVLQSKGNMQTYVNGQWGGMNDNLVFQSGIDNSQWTEVAPGYIKIDSFKQNDIDLAQRTYTDPTGFYYTSATGNNSYLGNVLQTGQVQTPSLIGTYIGPSAGVNLLQIGSIGSDYGLRVGLYAGSEAVLSDFIYNSTTSTSSNVRITDHGHLMRTTSASKYKYNIKNPEIETTLGDRLLNIHMATWNDKHAVNIYAEELSTGEEREKVSIDKYYGLIAEQLRDAGLDMFIDYGKNHEIEGIQYDRAWIPLLSVIRRLNDKVNEYELRLSKLEGTNK